MTEKEVLLALGAVLFLAGKEYRSHEEYYTSQIPCYPERFNGISWEEALSIVAGVIDAAAEEKGLKVSE